MTDRIALWIGLVLLAVIAADISFNDGSGLTFLTRRLVNLIEWVVFWR